MTIRESIQQAMKAQKVSQYRLAKDCGCVSFALSLWFRGERDLKGETLQKLADRLGLELKRK